jgi:hypothetical protein
MSLALGIACRKSKLRSWLSWVSRSSGEDALMYRDVRMPRAQDARERRTRLRPGERLTQGEVGSSQTSSGRLCHRTGMPRMACPGPAGEAGSVAPLG